MRASGSDAVWQKAVLNKKLKKDGGYQASVFSFWLESGRISNTVKIFSETEKRISRPAKENP